MELPDNMGKDPIKLILGMGFASVLALMVLISFISLTQMGKATDGMSRLMHETRAKIAAAHTMRDSIRLRGDTLHNMYLSDDFIKRDELRIEMSVHALNYKDARDRLYSYPMTAREARLLDELMRSTRMAKALNDTAANELLSDKPDAEVLDTLKAANQVRQDMLDGLSRLVRLQEKIADEKLKEVQAYQGNLGSIIFYLCLIAILIAAYIAQKVIRETAKKSSEIHYHATHDSLTHLPNRMEFNRRLARACASAKAYDQRHVLCYMDLDRFKAVNDSCGHKAGDKLLVTLTQMIRNHIRGHDTFARLGGDEFGLLLEDCSLEKAVEITEGIVNIVRNYEFNWEGTSFHVGASIGVVTINSHTESAEAALNDADTACYAAKDLGRNQVHVHGQDQANSLKMQNELSWVSEINQGDDERFSLYIQQIKPVNAEDPVEMYEVLLRLNDDDGRLIPPGSYLPAAERFSLMKNVDFWVIRKSFEVLDKLARLTQKKDVKLFINISLNSLIDPDFTDYVIQQYLHFNITHDRVCFEIDEQKAAKNSRILAEVIKVLSPYSIQFALDDFGKGVSSISYLKELPVDYLKISGSVVKNITQSITDRAMVTAVADVGKVMNIQVIAKHVENAFVMNQLRDMDIDFVQGFHVRKPCAVADCFSKLEQASKLSVQK